MDDRHTAENIAFEINEIVNQYDFDKQKITSISTDDGVSFTFFNFIFLTIQNELIYFHSIGQLCTLI